MRERVDARVRVSVDAGYSLMRTARKATGKGPVRAVLPKHHAIYLTLSHSAVQERYTGLYETVWKKRNRYEYRVPGP